jgi:hypothetical protein
VLKIALVLLCCAGCSETGVQLDLAVADLSAVADLAFAAPACEPKTIVANPFSLIVRPFGPGGARLSGALVELRKRSDESLLASGITDSTGQVALSFATGGAAPDLYVVASVNDTDGGTWTPTWYEDAGGVPSGVVLGLGMTTSARLHQIAAQAGTAWNEANQVTDVAFTACGTSAPVLPGAVVSIVPGDAVRYQTLAGGFDATLTATADSNATAFNVPPGPIAVDAIYHGARISYSTHAHAGVYHVITLHP